MFQKKSAATLQQKADRILSVFTRTRQELYELVTEQQDMLEDIESEQEALRLEAGKVSEQIRETTKVISNIEKLLS